MTKTKTKTKTGKIRYSTNERTPLSVPMSPSHSEYLKFVNKGPSAQDNVKW